jgi:hypothetical protein
MLTEREEKFVKDSVDKIINMLYATVYYAGDIKQIKKDADNPMCGKTASLPMMTIDVCRDRQIGAVVKYATEISKEDMRNKDLTDDIIAGVNSKICLLNKKSQNIINDIKKVIDNYPVKISVIRVADRQSNYIKDFLIKATSAEANIELKYPINSTISRDDLLDNDVHVILDYINSRL